MLAIDPPLGNPGQAATVGGVIATADSGPLRHRYGAPRDLVLGMTVALSDGTIARSGSKVIKNVAGYDLAKLFTGSFGTLGIILSVSVRLHPLPLATATALGASSDPADPVRRRRRAVRGAAGARGTGSGLARRPGRRPGLRGWRGGHTPGQAGRGADEHAGTRAGRRGRVRRGAVGSSAGRAALARARAGQARRAPEPARGDPARGRRRRRHAGRSRRAGHELRRGRPGRGGAPARGAGGRASTRSCSTLRRTLAPSSTPGGHRIRWRSG